MTALHHHVTVGEFSGRIVEPVLREGLNQLFAIASDCIRLKIPFIWEDIINFPASLKKMEVTHRWQIVSLSLTEEGGEVACRRLLEGSSTCQYIGLVFNLGTGDLTPVHKMVTISVDRARIDFFHTKTCSKIVSNHLFG